MGALAAGAFVPRLGKKDSQAVQVVASFYPMAEFARQVGGPRVSVTTVVGAGVEPHDYEPTPRDLARLYDADVVVYNGVSLEPWLDKLKPNLAKSGVILVEASAGLPLLRSSSGDAPADPHLWVDPTLASRQAARIAQAFTKADPKGATTYAAHAAAYQKKLLSLHHAFQKTLSACKSRDIFTSHQAFAYIARTYHLQVNALAGLSPDSEPSPQKLAQLATLARKQHITHVFFETLVSPKLANTLAREIGAETLVFNPLEGLTEQEDMNGKNYISIQKDNLQALATALHCKQDVATTY